MREQFEELMDIYANLKQQVRRADPYLYERWKAGGFLIDNDIMSMYPNLGEVVERLDGEDEDFEDEEPTSLAECN